LQLNYSVQTPILEGSNVKYFKHNPQNNEGFFDNNPLTGVANLFDLGLVFMMGLLVALFGAYHLVVYSKKTQI
jgi:hypothetical protein